MTHIARWVHDISAPTDAGRGTSAGRRLPHIFWFVAVMGLAFLVPYVFTSRLDVDHDLYYFIYFSSILAALTAYVRFNGVDLAGLFVRNWRSSLVLGAGATAFVVWNVLAREEATPHPAGAYFGFEIMWRGVVYGVVDALLLSAFPAAVAFGVLDRDLSGPAQWLKFAALTTALVLAITAVYHLGYEHFREDGVAKPETGNMIMSVPMIVSLNPLGSVVAHTSMHVAAVVNSYETDTFLPPQTYSD